MSWLNKLLPANKSPTIDQVFASILRAESIEGGHRYTVQHFNTDKEALILESYPKTQFQQDLAGNTDAVVFKLTGEDDARFNEELHQFRMRNARSTQANSASR